MGCGSSHIKYFGGNLETLWDVEGDVPQVLRLCMRRIVEVAESTDISVGAAPTAPCKDLFRTVLSGGLGDQAAVKNFTHKQLMAQPEYKHKYNTVQAFKAGLNSGKTQAEGAVMSMDVAAVAWLFVDFLRELQDSVIPASFHDNVVAAMAGVDNVAHIVQLRAVMESLPAAHRATTSQIMQFFAKISQPSMFPVFGLTAQHLGLLFAPVVLRRSLRNKVVITPAESEALCNAITLLIAEYDAIFMISTAHHVAVLMEEVRQARAAQERRDAIIENATRMIIRHRDSLNRRDDQELARVAFHAWVRHVAEKQGKLSVYSRMKLLSELLEAEQRQRVRLQVQQQYLLDNMELATFKTRMVDFLHDTEATAKRELATSLTGPGVGRGLLTYDVERMHELERSDSLALARLQTK